MLLKENKSIKVLIFIGHYLPGFKSGGILRSVENTINNLGHEFEFSIITRDRDLGEMKPYLGVKSNQWQWVGGVKVFYLGSEDISLSKICDLINNTPHDIIYLNSFFEPLTVNVLFSKKRNKIGNSPIILAPRGEFAWASLRLKYPKKLLYMFISKLLCFYNDIVWHASTVIEQEDIFDKMNVDVSKVLVAKDLPIKTISPHTKVKDAYESSDFDLRVVFISRISPEKNLDYALRILSKANKKIVFDVYGSIENEKYWNKCKTLIDKLPENIKMSYCGELEPQNVVKTFSGYDVFFFPSGGENYGHVIAESLSAGTPVLVSHNTPWLGLEQKNLGWDVDLKEIDRFVDIINKLALMSKSERDVKRAYILDKIDGILFNSKDYEDNRQLYLQTIIGG